MTKDEISLLINEGVFPCSCSNPKLIETHISWVILCNEFVFKIKKPLKYSFLDFSTIDKRLFYCKEEIRLNWRLTFNVYLGIHEIRSHSGRITMDGTNGQLIDHAVRMRRLNGEKQMSFLLENDLVREEDIKNIAARIAQFHKRTRVVYKKNNNHSLSNKFNDLRAESDFLGEQLGHWSGVAIENAIKQSDAFLKEYDKLIKTRQDSGYHRDVHGDLHSGNIFLLPEPVIFDCIEFNEEYREIDILNEVAFLAMDLDAHSKKSLSDLLLDSYAHCMSISLDEQTMQLFQYYKAYRANIRAKVNSLRARSANAGTDRDKPLSESAKYLYLMERYLTHIK